MKLIALLLLLCTVTLMFSSCARKKVDKPTDTNLEYWLLDKPDLSGLIEIESNHPCTESFLAKGYEAITDEKGMLTAPNEAVVYDVEVYPYKDLNRGTKRVACIRITDPNVCVWNLTINSSREEIIETLEAIGYEIYAERQGFSISFRLSSDDDWKVIIIYNQSIKISCDFLYFYQL